MVAHAVGIVKDIVTIDDVHRPCGPVAGHRFIGASPHGRPGSGICRVSFHEYRADGAIGLSNLAVGGLNVHALFRRRFYGHLGLETDRPVCAASLLHAPMGRR